ncbi:MAG: flagellar hook-basal body complex protein [Sphingobium sp.]|jgi:flagellar basal-body rod protein FlgF|nr:flagellar hook-basal body complex protein [Sphingobium sp.]MCI1271338.1 flagellar hook-basal body complex protein [Sphingobium sp.]MCI1756851.1 flagellar hook-basal body complex protein [Sphingobium sp.]MCI2053971.1 flagellar hook-basal body complex protein [Sphingobium sp.]
MDNSTYVLLSHEQALRRRLDVAANNMANSETAGFRRERPVFREYIEQMEGRPPAELPAQARGIAFVQDYRAMQDARAGAFQATGNPLDIMIDGPGWLSVQDANGETAYTRAGFLKVSDAGELVTSGGQKVLDEGGTAITVPPDALASLAIGPDGTLSYKDGTLARIGVTVFDDETALAPRGDGLMTGSGGRALALTDTHIKSGGVESSNVQPIAETTELIDILRSYQSSMAISNAINELRKDAISRLGRIG